MYYDSEEILKMMPNGWDYKENTRSKGKLTGTKDKYFLKKGENDKTLMKITWFKKTEQFLKHYQENGDEYQSTGLVKADICKKLWDKHAVSEKIKKDLKALPVKNGTPESSTKKRIGTTPPDSTSNKRKVTLKSKPVDSIKETKMSPKKIDVSDETKKW